MVKDLDALVLFIFENPVELYTVSVKLSQIERPEVLVIALVNQHIVHVKEETVSHILGRLLVAEPVQSI